MQDLRTGTKQRRRSTAVCYCTQRKQQGRQRQDDRRQPGAMGQATRAMPSTRNKLTYDDTCNNGYERMHTERRNARSKSAAGEAHGRCPGLSLHIRLVRLNGIGRDAEETMIASAGNAPMLSATALAVARAAASREAYGPQTTMPFRHQSSGLHTE